MVLTSLGLRRGPGGRGRSGRFAHAGMSPLSRLCKLPGEEQAEGMAASDDQAWSSPRQDSMTTQSKPIFVLPEAGKNLHFPQGDIASIMLSGKQTGGTLAVVASTQAPDSGPPLHIHWNEDELFLLVEGHYSFFAEGRWVEVGAGGAVYLPKGIAHRYRNIGTTTGRHWVITTPSGWGDIHDSVRRGVGKLGWPISESNI